MKYAAVAPRVNHKSAQGFTLIEIMVVVVIMATIIAFVAVSITSDVDRLARLEAERFMLVVNEVRDEAIISGENFILSVDEDRGSYEFSASRSNRSTAQDDGLLRVRNIEQEVELDWDVIENFSSDDSEDEEPRVLISPLGEITLFELRFGGDEQDVLVVVNDENLLEQQIKQN